jgi:hypothetical protein
MIMVLTLAYVSLPVFKTLVLAWSDGVWDSLPRRVAASLAERFGECVAELPVVGFELADALGCELKPGSQ